MATYDLLIAGGRVIDPASSIDGLRDIGIVGGRIASVEQSIEQSDARQVIDVSGLVVTPGLVDIHTHLFFTGGNPHALVGDWSVQPDPLAFRTGVTTLVDAGSAGWRNFGIFRTTVIDRAATRVLALVNISGYGMIRDSSEQGDFNPGAVAAVHANHADVVVGVKTAHYREPDWRSVDAAIGAGEMARIPVMVDFGSFLPERPYHELVSDWLRPGDISTHIFKSAVPWIDEGGRLFSYLTAARQRGIRFDLGHGGGGFVFRNAVPAVANGFVPDSISTDMHGNSVTGPMMDMPALMSKMMAVGMPLSAVVEASTCGAADVIGRPELGRLSPGSDADLAVFALDEGAFGFADTRGGRLEGSTRFTCELTVREGKVVWDLNARQARDYRELGPRYGMNSIDSYIVPSPAGQSRVEGR
jgi:dihydroorotase